MAGVFACVGCGAVLTAPLSRVALPDHAHQSYGYGLFPVLMDPGTYAVDPEPSGPPWRLWDEVGEGEAETRGVFAPVSALSLGAPGAILVSPGDTRGTVLMLEQCDGGCCGLDGRDGPNLACEGCGRAVATRIDDCSRWQAVWLDPKAVHRLPTDGPETQWIGWEALANDREGTPPVEPSGVWSPRWAAAVGTALAHLVAASAGTAVSVPDGPVADIFRRSLDALLPSGPTAKTAVLAGPGLQAPDPAAAIVLVPRHPQTGRAWQPSGTADTVPLAAEVWAYLAFHSEQLLVPASGRLPDGVLRDDPLPLHPWGPFRPDSGVFRSTLARLPVVRQPWLHRIYDDVSAQPYARPF
ncbi:hypothetical protein C8250_040440 [Streptomyces sp. So13.3]|nr:MULTISPECIES: hypothetical protein [unclassified Streptomyces]MCZ4102706.1 hypothetical protein [Streptomyces sp. H39-C1]QNA77269.1 hypothetical protein C8250_040440 [Streptomyces sp. So13.3]